jgi:prepilin-type N-terminal cleavage/methylation domain-containing protein/prepilin-type processing-associated H-X9-DG protein
MLLAGPVHLIYKTNVMTLGRTSRRSDAAARGAFTLVELLAVIAIIAVLAALLFPVLRGAMDKGRNASCLANLKQIGAGVVLFGADQEGSTPLEYYSGASPARPDQPVWWYWADLIQPYADPAKPRPVTGGAGESILELAGRSSVFDCPANRNDRFDYKYNIRIGSYNQAVGISINCAFSPVESDILGYRSYFGVKLDAVTLAGRAPPAPSQFVLVTDLTDFQYPALPNFNPNTPANFRTRSVLMHDNATRFNAAYADGHVVNAGTNALASYTGGAPFDLPVR